MNRRLTLCAGAATTLAAAALIAGHKQAPPAPVKSMVSQVSTTAGGERTPVEPNFVAVNRPVLEPAARNPFAHDAPSAPPPPKLPSPSPVPIVVATPAPAAPPPLNLRFAGRMRTPDGTTLVFASLGSETVALTPGVALSNGYRVTRITDRVAEFSYPPLGTQATLNLPEPPAFEIR